VTWRLNFRYSIILFLFWLIITFANGLILRSKIIYDFSKDIENGTNFTINLSPINNATFTNLDIKAYYVYFVCLIASLILSAMTEKNFNFSNTTRKPPKEETVNLISYLLFWWTNPLIRTGFKRDLKDNDLYEIPDENKSQSITSGMESAWNSKMHEYLNKLKLEEDNNTVKFVVKKKIYKLKEGDDEEIKLNLTENGDSKTKSKSKSKFKAFFQWRCCKKKEKAITSEPSLGLCLTKLFLVKFTAIITIKLSHDILNFARPILLDKLINFIKDKEQKLYIGFFYIFLLCLASLVQTLIMQHYYQVNITLKTLSIF
jgi:ATP-binding cassette subfamily C (CFTR/MRP) protein 1